MKEWYRKRKLRGLCYRCQEPALEGRTHCKVHMEAAAAKWNAITDRRRKTGLCSCGRRAAKNDTQCPRHIKERRKAQNERARRYRRLGLCKTCSSPTTEGRTRCNRCLLKGFPYLTRKSATERGLAVTVSDEYLVRVAKRPCHFCGSVDSRGFNGIDRKNTKIGYVRGNMLPSCWIHNNMKGTLSYENFLLAVSRMAKHLRLGGERSYA